MNKFCLILPVFVLAFTVAGAQRLTRNFSITLPEDKVSGSLYRRLSFMDCRMDTTQMGVVQQGAFNRKARVVAETPLHRQLEELLAVLTDSTAADGRLLFQLRELSFAEITGAMSEKGYFYLRAALYAADAGGYRKIAFIDTVVLIKAFDVTNALFRNGSKTINGFIASALKQPPGGMAPLSLEAVAKIDSIEKRELPLYNTDKCADGLYENWESFVQQKPGSAATIKMGRNGRIEAVYAPGKDGKPEKVKSKNVYAVVNAGQPFIATGYGWYPLAKSGDDFYFTGRAKINASTGDVIAASFFFGIIGGLLASDADALFDMKIDHLNGGFIRLRELGSSPE